MVVVCVVVCARQMCVVPHTVNHIVVVFACVLLMDVCVGDVYCLVL